VRETSWGFKSPLAHSTQRWSAPPPGTRSEPGEHPPDTGPPRSRLSLVPELDDAAERAANAPPEALPTVVEVPANGLTLARQSDLLVERIRGVPERQGIDPRVR
jgi:hypothetical protein